MLYCNSIQLLFHNIGKNQKNLIDLQMSTKLKYSVKKNDVAKYVMKKNPAPGPTPILKPDCSKITGIPPEGFEDEPEGENQTNVEIIHHIQSEESVPVSLTNSPHPPPLQASDKEVRFEVESTSPNASPIIEKESTTFQRHNANSELRSISRQMDPHGTAHVSGDRIGSKYTRVMNRPKGTLSNYRSTATVSAAVDLNVAEEERDQFFPEPKILSTSTSLRAVHLKKSQKEWQRRQEQKKKEQEDLLLFYTQQKDTIV